MAFGKIEVSADLAPLSFHHLIHHWFLQHYFSAWHAQNHIAFCTNPQLLRALQIEPDGSGISPRRNNKIIFQFSLIPIENQIHPRINVCILHVPKGGHVRAPLSRITPDKVARPLQQFVYTADSAAGFAPSSRMRTVVFVLARKASRMARDVLKRLRGDKSCAMGLRRASTASCAVKKSS